ncbi:MAG: hypothetical protein HRU17_20715 [Polyangiaceae bacterium]|nr:hypothetical protein [Polyangiaceae bacterium]
MACQRARRLIPSSIALAGVLAAACSSDSSSTIGSSNADGDSGASATGMGGTGSGGTATGGTAGSATATGGSATATGGSAGTGGGGGSDAGLPECGDTSSATTTSLCANFVPDVVDLISSDPDHDGQGVGVLAVFESSDPEAAEPIYVQRIPAINETGIYDLSTIRVDIDKADIASTVYMQFLFFDGPEPFGNEDAGDAGDAGSPDGMWLGGYDMAGGIAQSTPLAPVEITMGQGHAVALPVFALRKISVTGTASTALPSNGEGRLEFFAMRTRDVNTIEDGGAVSFGELACVDLNSPVVIEGFVYGSGTFYLGGFFHDDGDVDDAAGLVLSAELPVSDLGSVTFPAANAFTVGTRYVLQESLVLNYSPDPSGDAGVSGDVSCQ